MHLQRKRVNIRSIGAIDACDLYLMMPPLHGNAELLDSFGGPPMRWIQGTNYLKNTHGFTDADRDPCRR